MGKTISKPSAKAAINGSANGSSSSQRLEVLKTYKIYIGGKFPRTESGRYYSPKNSAGDSLANICLSSRKDFRNSVVAARKAFGPWAARAAFNRSQILYRIGEMLEGRKAQFVDELIRQDYSKRKAEQEVELAIDRFIYYAGWCDKYQQIFSSVNPVASSHFNFSNTESMGVVAAMASEEDGLLGLVSLIAPVIAGGNSIVILASESKPLCSITLAEVLATSDLPGGVVNILTGNEKELIEHFTTHMDVNALLYSRGTGANWKMIQEKAALNVKRAFNYTNKDWQKDEGQSPYYILDTQEIKTTWHPIENIGGASASY